jgi:hypothetical protein
VSEETQRAVGALERIKALGKKALTPSVYYRNLRPELFSDTRGTSSPNLTKSLLEFQLDQLTANKKEHEFEEFCRRLAEHEICSNLMPQTGPVGGGDSKVDAATYPVATGLAERRYWCGKARPTSEDWGFAFSAKKDWRTKVKDDVGKIAQLPRKFQQIFFITNQPARDKVRAELEASLSSTSGARVTILDRSWIVEKVLASKLEGMTVACLGLDVGMQHERVQGPNDVARDRELSDLLEKLKGSTIAPQNDYALAQDYLEAAKLATELERPRPEIDGLFLQARDLAKKSEHTGLIIRCYYHHAWRTYFYFDDGPRTEEIFQEMQAYLPEVHDTEEAELFCNLASLLQTATDIGFFRQAEEKLKARNVAIRGRLEVIASDQSRPNNALHAETLLNELALREARFDRDAAAKCFARLKKCLKRSAGLGAYPLLKFTDIWEFYGQYFCDLPGYAELQAQMQRTLASRIGEVEAGQRQLTFGLQLLEKGLASEALKELAEAQRNLRKEETLDDSVRATFGCAACYGVLGLNWAARMELLSAAHVALNSMERFHEMPRRGAFVALRMSWKELQLGRIGPFLVWRNFLHGLLNVVDSLGIDTKMFAEELVRQDGCLSCLLMKVAPDDLAEITDLDQCLGALDLDFARFALLYRTGRRQQVVDEMAKVPGFSNAELDSTMALTCNQPAYAEAPDHLCDETRTICEFRTRLFGVNYRIRCRNKLGPILFAENLLGVLESALALAKWENLAFVVDEVVLFIDEDLAGKNPPDIKFGHSESSSEEKLLWKPDMIEWMRTSPVELRNFLHSLLLHLLFTTTIDPINDLKQELANWNEQKSFERALSATPTSVAIIDLLGRDKYDLNYWINSASP